MTARKIEDDRILIAYWERQLEKELDAPTDDNNLKRIEEYVMLLEKASKGKYDPDPETKKRNLNELHQLFRNTSNIT